LKIRVFFGWYKFVNAYVEGDKKIFGLAVFGVQIPTLLIDFEPRVGVVYYQLFVVHS